MSSNLTTIDNEASLSKVKNAVNSTIKEVKKDRDEKKKTKQAEELMKKEKASMDLSS